MSTPPGPTPPTSPVPPQAHDWPERPDVSTATPDDLYEVAMRIYDRIDDSAPRAHIAHRLIEADTLCQLATSGYMREIRDKLVGGGDSLPPGVFVPADGSRVVITGPPPEPDRKPEPEPDPRSHLGSFENPLDIRADLADAWDEGFRAGQAADPADWPKNPYSGSGS